MKHLKMLFLYGTLFFVVFLFGCSTSGTRVPSDYSPEQREVIDLAELFVEKLASNSYEDVMAIIKTNDLVYWFMDGGERKVGGYKDFSDKLDEFYSNALLRKARLVQVSLPLDKFSDESATIFAGFEYEYEIREGEKKGTIESKKEPIQMVFTKDQKSWKLSWLTGQTGHGLLFPIKIKG